MKISILISVFILAISAHSISQPQPIFRFGISAGASGSKMITPYHNDNDADKVKYNVYPKLFCRLPLKHNFWLQTECCPVDYGSVFVYNDDTLYQKMTESRYFLQFTEVAGYSVNLSPQGGCSLNLMAGPFFNRYLISHEKSYTDYKLRNQVLESSVWQDVFNHDDPQVKPRKSQAGISIGAGLSKTFNYGTVLVDLRYDQCLTSPSKVLDKNLDYLAARKFHYRVISVSAGFIFGKNNKKH